SVFPEVNFPPGPRPLLLMADRGLRLEDYRTRSSQPSFETSPSAQGDLRTHAWKKSALGQKSGGNCKPSVFCSQFRHSRWDRQSRQVFLACAIAMPPALRTASTGSTPVRSIIRSN